MARDHCDMGATSVTTRRSNAVATRLKCATPHRLEVPSYIAVGPVITCFEWIGLSSLNLRKVRRPAMPHDRYLCTLGAGKREVGIDITPFGRRGHAVRPVEVLDWAGRLGVERVEPFPLRVESPHDAPRDVEALGRAFHQVRQIRSSHWTSRDASRRSPTAA